MTNCKLRPAKKGVIQNGDGAGCYGCSEPIDINNNKWERLTCKSCPILANIITSGRYTTQVVPGMGFGKKALIVRDEEGDFFREWQI